MAAISRIITRNFRTSRILQSQTGAHNKDAEKAAKLWTQITNFFALPVVFGLTVYMGYNHFNHTPHRPEFVNYEYMRMRKTKFPWGDGNHSLFHNHEVNALPDGYEDA